MSEFLNFSFTFNRDNLSDIIAALKDLNKIDTMIKIKMDQDDVLFYSKAGKDHNVHALKSFIFPISDFIIADEYPTLDFIIINGKNFVENLSIYLTRDSDIAGKFKYKNNDKIASMLYITDGTLKFNFITGDYKQIKDISKLDIENKMNPDLANFSFDLTNDTFKEIKKLSGLNKSEIVSLRMKGGKLSFFDLRWSYDVTDLPTVDDETWSFANKYLKSINSTNDITINMFDQFLLFKEDNISLMIGLELGEL